MSSSLPLPPQAPLADDRSSTPAASGALVGLLRGRQAALQSLDNGLRERGARLVLQAPLGTGKAALVAAWQHTTNTTPVLWLDAQQHLWRDELRELAAATGQPDERRATAQALLTDVCLWLATRGGTLAVRHTAVATPPAWQLLPWLQADVSGVRCVLLCESVPQDCDWPVLTLGSLTAAATQDWPGLQDLPLQQACNDWLRPQPLRLLASALRVLLPSEGQSARDALHRLVLRPLDEDRSPADLVAELAWDRLSGPARTLALGLAALGGETESLPAARWLGADLMEHLRTLAEWGWLGSHPADASRLYLLPALQRWLRTQPTFGAVQGTFERYVAFAVQKRVDRRGQGRRVGGGTAPLHLAVQAQVARNAVALAARLVDLSAELLLEAGLAGDLADLAQRVLDVVPEGAPAHTMASHALALAYRGQGDVELADALLTEALRLAAGTHGLRRHAVVCLSRFAAPRPQPASLEDWLDEPGRVPAEPVQDPAETTLEQSDNWLLFWLESQSPRQDRSHLAARLRADRAKTLRLARQPVSAWRLISQSLPVLRQLPRRDDRARWLAEAALCQAGVGEWGQAADLLQESANHWHDCEQFLAEAETLARLAAWREYSGDVTGAKGLRGQVDLLRGLHDRVGDPQDLRDKAKQNETLAHALLETGEVEAARVCLTESAAALRKLDVPATDARLVAVLTLLAQLSE